MKLGKTEQGRVEFAAGVRTLGQRERTFLLLVDGRKAIGEISNLLRWDASLIAAKLIEEGYVEELLLPGIETSHLLHADRRTEKSIAKSGESVVSRLGEVGIDPYVGRRSKSASRSR